MSLLLSRDMTIAATVHPHIRLLRLSALASEITKVNLHFAAIAVAAVVVKIRSPATSSLCTVPIVYSLYLTSIPVVS